MSELVTVRDLADRLGMSPQGIRTILWRFPERFDSPPRYRREDGHPRRHRALTMREARIVAEMVVKRTAMGGV